MNMNKYSRSYLTEFLGTFFLVFIGCSVIAASKTFPEIGHLGISLAFGIVIFDKITNVKCNQ